MVASASSAHFTLCFTVCRAPSLPPKATKKERQSRGAVRVRVDYAFFSFFAAFAAAFSAFSVALSAAFFAVAAFFAALVFAA